MKGRGRRWAILAAATAVIAAIGMAMLLGEGTASSAKISGQVLLDTAGGEDASFVIYLGNQADVSAAYDMKDQDARGWYVYNTLKEHAARTQAPLKAELEAQNVPYKSYWAVNMIVADGEDPSSRTSPPGPTSSGSSRTTARTASRARTLRRRSTRGTPSRRPRSASTTSRVRASGPSATPARAS